MYQAFRLSGLAWLAWAYGPKRLSQGAGWTTRAIHQSKSCLENMFTNKTKQRCWRLVPDLFCRGPASGAKRTKLTAKRLENMFAIIVACRPAGAGSDSSDAAERALRAVRDCSLGLGQNVVPMSAHVAGVGPRHEKHGGKHVYKQIELGQESIPRSKLTNKETWQTCLQTNNHVSLPTNRPPPWGIGATTKCRL